MSFLYFQGEGATLCCGLQASHCSGFTCCREQALRVGFSICSVWAQWVGDVKSLSCVWLFVTPWTVAHQAPGILQAQILEWVAISVVVAYRLSCSTACRIFLDQGSNPCLYIGRWILICHQGSPENYFFCPVPFNVRFPNLSIIIKSSNTAKKKIEAYYNLVSHISKSSVVY